MYLEISFHASSCYSHRSYLSSSLSRHVSWCKFDFVPCCAYELTPLFVSQGQTMFVTKSLDCPLCCAPTNFRFMFAVSVEQETRLFDSGTPSRLREVKRKETLQLSTPLRKFASCSTLALVPSHCCRTFHSSCQKFDSISCFGTNIFVFRFFSRWRLLWNRSCKGL